MSVELRTFVRAMGGLACAASTVLATAAMAGAFTAYAPVGVAAAQNGDVWVEAAGGAGGPAGDVHASCGAGELMVRAMGLTQASGALLVHGWAPSGGGSADIDWSGSWHFDVAQGGVQTIAVISTASLQANARAHGDVAQPLQGFHFKVEIDGRGGVSVGDDRFATFWLGCAGVPASPSASGGGTPTSSMTTSAGAGLATDNSGDIWIDVAGRNDGPETDVHFSCSARQLWIWGMKLAGSTGPVAIQGWPPSGGGSSDIDWTSTWHYGTAQGGQQVIAIVDVATLLAGAQANGDSAQAQQGLHFKIDLEDPRTGASMGDDKHKTFWIMCPPPTSTASPTGTVSAGTPTPTVPTSPSPSESASSTPSSPSPTPTATPTSTPTATVSAGTPTPSASETPTARMSPSPSASATATPTLPTPTVSTPTPTPTSGVGGATATPTLSTPTPTSTPSSGVLGTTTTTTTTPSGGVRAVTTPNTGTSLPFDISGGLMAGGLGLLALSRRMKRRDAQK